MSINAITASGSTYQTSSKSSDVKKDKTTSSTTATSSDPAAVYEKGNVDKSSYTSKTSNAKIVAQMKADAEQRSNQLRDLVQNMLVKQGHVNAASMDIYKALRTGQVTVDSVTASQAAKDIADDGYWGVEQTSDRLVSFAKALSGGDPDKADTMINAVKKGFKQATEAWGDKLPDICQRTLDTTMEKLDAWKNGTEE